MARVYLDANKIIDFVEKKIGDFEEELETNEFFVSVLSWHIVTYVCKWRVPNRVLEGLVDRCQAVTMDSKIVMKALNGPTQDFEDNIQLHSAVAGDCDVFLTSDRKLLKMRYFGKVKISDRVGID